MRQYADPPTRFPSRRPILNGTTSPLYPRRYTKMLRKEPNCLRDALQSTLPRDRRGLTPNPVTNNSLWTTHGILTLIRAPFFNAFVRLNIMGQLLLLKSIMYLIRRHISRPPLEMDTTELGVTPRRSRGSVNPTGFRGKATPVTRERGPLPARGNATPDRARPTRPNIPIACGRGLVRME
jgi:hypothetical protein